MNRQLELERLIDEDTAKHILGSMERSIEPAKLPGFVYRLRTLFAVAFVEQQRSPRNIRSALEKSLSPLIKEIRSLQDRLSPDNLQHLRIPLDAAALDIYVQNSKKGSSNSRTEVVGYIAVPDILKRIERPLHELESVVGHLCHIIDKFDKLSLEAQSDSFFGGTDDKERYTRQQLYPFIRKRGGVGTDTYMVRIIAGLYQFAFERNFKIYSQTDKPRYLKQQTAMEKSETEESEVGGKSKNKIELARYGGDGLKFACVVLKELGLARYMVPLKESDLLSRFPRKKAAEHKDPIDQYDLAKLNRGLFGGAPKDVQLINKIGDIWDNDKKRRGAKPLHS